MKKTIYKYFFYDFIRYFVIVVFALTSIIWTIQAVNFLDLVTDDGHALSIYLFYSTLTIPKIITKIIPFAFLITTIMTILKFEKDNELIVFWTSGLNKIHIVNLVFRISLLLMCLQLIMSSFVTPQILNSSRSLLKNSELQFVPSLLREKQFNDTVKGLTIFVTKKNPDKTYEDIFIRDDTKVLTDVSSKSSTIFAKHGYITQDEKGLALIDGNIQKMDENNNISVIKFKKTILNLSGISTKTISEPKIQETSTLSLLLCLRHQTLNPNQEFNLDNNILVKKWFQTISKQNCSGVGKNLRDTKSEFNRRFGMPIFIPLIGLITCFLLSSRRENKFTSYKKYLCFLIGVVLIIASEIAVRYSGISWKHTSFYFLLPIGLFPLVYLRLVREFKYENLN